jgi:choline dehydrogenase-like flavoprotein
MTLSLWVQGTAGCVIAARLSEGGGAHVLLLEAGSRHPSPAMAVPAAWPSLQGTSADWADTTVPQAATGRPMHRPRGRGLGGSSAINAMNFVRGQGADPQQRGHRYAGSAGHVRRHATS